MCVRVMFAHVPVMMLCHHARQGWNSPQAGYPECLIYHLCQKLFPTWYITTWYATWYVIRLGELTVPSGSIFDPDCHLTPAKASIDNRDNPSFSVCISKPPRYISYASVSVRVAAILYPVTAITASLYLAVCPWTTLGPSLLPIYRHETVRQLGPLISSNCRCHSKKMNSKIIC